MLDNEEKAKIDNKISKQVFELLKRFTEKERKRARERKAIIDIRYSNNF